MRQRHTYLEDTYRCTVDTQVIDSGKSDKGPWVALEDNIFHPQGGGQPSDMGSVGGAKAHPFKAPVGDDHVVRLAREREFELAEKVACEIDPDLRRLHAALHTCGHVVDGVVRAMGFRHRVSNHFPGQARIEFDSGQEKPDLERLAISVDEQTRQAIDSDRKVYAVDRGGLRVVVIDGLNEDPCGGTHVSSLGQLSGFSLRSVKVKGEVLKVGYTVAYGE